MSDYMDFGFDDGDNKIQGGKFERFKAKEGETYRVSFIWFPEENGKVDLDAKSPRFTGGKRFFIPNVGYILDGGPEFAKIANATSKAAIATVLAIWPTDRKGQLDKNRFASGDVEVMPWVFSQDKYEQLKRRNTEFPFGQYDLTIACTDTQFQKLDLTPCRENLFRKCLETEKLAPIAAAITAKLHLILGLNEAGEPAGLRDIVARNVSIEKVREKLGGAPASSPSNNVNSAAVDSLLDDLLS